MAISLAKEYLNSNITATDISKLALKVARINSKNYNACKQIKFVCCDWINKIEHYDVVVSNPPYLTTKEYNIIKKEIKNHEPKIALLGGGDGLICYRKLAHKISKITHLNTLCFVEFGYNQKDACIKIFKEFGMDCIDIIADYQNYERILVLKKKKILKKY